MPEVTDVWLLAVALDGEDTFWLCEPTNLKPLAPDWKSTSCRWLYPVEENVSRFADLSGFDSTDSVYEVDWNTRSVALRAATLTWNVKGKRQKMGRTTYVFVPAEDMKIMDEAYGKFLKIEAMKPPPPRTASSAGIAFPRVKEEPKDDDDGPVPSPLSNASFMNAGGSDALLEEASTSRTPSDARINMAREGREGEDEDEEVSNVSSSEFGRRWRESRGRRKPQAALNSHKRQTPHRGTTVYQAAPAKNPTGDHRSNEAFDWPEMFLVHCGSVDYLCRYATNNRYGFRLTRIMNDGFPVFLLFSTRVNNSESIDPNRRGVAVFERAALNGEDGEGQSRSSVLVVTRLMSPKHPSHKPNTKVSVQRQQLPRGKIEPADELEQTQQSRSTRQQRRPQRSQQRRRRRRFTDSDEDSFTEDDEDYSEDDDDDEDYNEDDDDDDDDDEDEEYEDEDDKPLYIPHLQEQNRVKNDAPTSKRQRTEGDVLSRGRGRKAPEEPETEALQAVSVNFWTDPQGVVPAVSQLATEYPFNSDGADTPQTVVFADGTCVTYTAATGAKHGVAEKKRNAPKHSHSAASTEDADLSMLNEHILNAFAQVRKEGAE